MSARHPPTSLPISDISVRWRLPGESSLVRFLISLGSSLENWRRCLIYRRVEIMMQWRRARNGCLLGFLLSGCLLWSNAGRASGASTVESRMQAWGASQDLCKTDFQDMDLPEDFYCLKVQVPVPSTDPTGKTLTTTTAIRFAIHPAEGPADTRLGVLVTLVGGPGEIGLEDAPSYLEGLSGTIRNSFDLVWFNQRGIDPSHNVQCSKAQQAFTSVRRTFPYPIDTKEKFKTMSDAVSAYALACHDEIGNKALLPSMGTDQSVADIEAFRTKIGEAKLYLYGQSYGTQFGQTYVRAYPNSANRMVLDGAVDMTLTGMEYFKLQVPAFDQALRGALNWCAQDPACKKGFAGKDPLAFYDQLAAELATGPAQVQFPVPVQNPAPAARELPVPPAPQNFQKRNFYLADLEMLAYGLVYSPSMRADLLRWLAAAASGDRVPLLRATYAQWPLDPTTETPSSDANDAGYYSVECLDFAYDSKPQPFFDLETGLLAKKTRIASAAFIDLPCAFWPNATRQQTRPGPFAPDVPILLLNGDLDPATPVQDVRRMITFLKKGNKIELANAGHVILDMGNPCVVPQADTFLTSRAPLPTAWDCTTATVSGYLPLAQIEQNIVHVYDLEISSLPEYRSWERENNSTLVIGCTWGGTASFEFKETGGNSDESWSLNRCSMLKGMELSAWGTLHHDEDQGTDTLELTAWYTHPKEREHYTRNGAYDLGNLPVPGDVSWTEGDRSGKNPWERRHPCRPSLQFENRVRGIILRQSPAAWCCICVFPACLQ